jgi:hypothetical protein
MERRGIEPLSRCLQSSGAYCPQVDACYSMFRQMPHFRSATSLKCTESFALLSAIIRSLGHQLRHRPASDP